MSFKQLLFPENEDLNYTFSRMNYVLVAVSVIILIIGFYLLSGGTSTDPNVFYPNNDPNQVPEIFNFRRLTLAPIVILIGFFTMIFAILWKPKSKSEDK